jgi:hypothetical protein
LLLQQASIDTFPHCPLNGALANTFFIRHCNLNLNGQAYSASADQLDNITKLLQFMDSDSVGMVAKAGVSERLLS